MILTCPACDTKYVVKDGAIPAAGRQVRCASCKHSWHQDPEPALTERESVAVDFGGPPPPDADALPEPIGDIPEQAAAEGMIAGEPQPEIETGMAADHAEDADWQPLAGEEAGDFQPGPADASDEPQASPETAEMAEPTEWRAPVAPAEEEFVGYAPIGADEERPARRWPLLLGLLLLIVAAAAAFWFLAPAEWKARAGIADASATPLQLMITTRERQAMESGQELVLLGGRIVNPTGKEQPVPPIQVQLRDPNSQAVLHSWTIAPPKDLLGPGESASFNSGEVDQRREGDQLLDVKLSR